MFTWGYLLQNMMLYFKLASELTHRSRDQMAAISQATLSIVFSWMKMLEFRLNFHWNLFLRVQLTIFQHWFRYWLDAVQATSHYLNQWWLDYVTRPQWVNSSLLAAMYGITNKAPWRPFKVLYWLYHTRPQRNVSPQTEDDLKWDISNVEKLLPKAIQVKQNEILHQPHQQSCHVMYKILFCL